MAPAPRSAEAQIEEAEAARQRALLADCGKRVQEHAGYMRRAIDGGDVSAAVDRAADLVRELKVATLAPKTYFELYLQVAAQLRYLEEFFLVLNAKGTPMVQLYEHVQACAQVLPRLYLLCTVGSCYIRSGEAPAHAVLSDLLEMAKGVQQPMRGLFLRFYLSQVTKDKLPDTGTPYEGEGGSASATAAPAQLTARASCASVRSAATVELEQFKGAPANRVNAQLIARPARIRLRNGLSARSVSDCLEFVLENFAESNRLWVRMHAQAAVKDKRRRERERRDLRVLVGTNLERLSELEGVDAEMYKTAVLPRVLDQVVTCRDTIAQSYLMDCIVQGFPDEFHIHALPVFLESLLKLKEKVRVRLILESLMQRLSKYAETDGSALPGDASTFTQLNDCVARLIQERPSMDLAEIVLLQGSLLEFASRCYPSTIAYVDHCLGVAAQAVAVRTQDVQLSDAAVDALQRLLLAPLRSLGTQALSLERFAPLLGLLPWAGRAVVARALLTSVVALSEPLSDPDTVDRLLGMMAPLLVDPPVPPGAMPPLPPPAGTAAMEDVVADQQLAARLVHLIPRDDTDAAFEVMLTVRRHFGRGGETRIRHTLVPLVFAALALAQEARRVELAAAAAPPPPPAPSPPPLLLPSPPPGAATPQAAAAAPQQRADAGGGGGSGVSTPAAPQPKTIPSPIPSPPRSPAAAAAADDNGDGTQGAAVAELTAANAHGSPHSAAAAAAAEAEQETASPATSMVEVASEEAAQPADGEAADGGGAAAAALESPAVPPAAQAAAAAAPAPATPPAAAAAASSPQAAAVLAVAAAKAATVAAASPGADEDGAAAAEAAAAAAAPAVSPLKYGSRKMFQFVHETVTAMAPMFPAASLRLFLQCAIAADRAGFPAIAYEFVSQACILYEDELTEARAQASHTLNLAVSAVTALVGALTSCSGFNAADWEALAAKTAQYGVRLLRKPDQSRAVAMCSHLFWAAEDDAGAHFKRDARRVLECLQRALKIADGCMAGGTNVVLFVEVLNLYVYYFEHGNADVAEKYISRLVQLVRDQLQSMEPSPAKTQAEVFFRNTVASIVAKRSHPDVPEELRLKFAAVAL
ncbi:vacuolar protein sorting-associated protein 35 [Tribonema minus]|uniref:Vacuolar protein sorting-associated protein 35 n=1 Tax=Tribonema minus TaxID=303371 RepID=A0A835Z7F2_9STRA|nr:vacuolar protein sorting-associated protein 35 [Tribonema minus]